MNPRDLTLDFVKGILVIVMVVYHVMNYFSTSSPEAFGYVRFVSGSFIFISGYIISTFSVSKYQIDASGVSKRLFGRGVKLLLIFTFLNILINLTGIGNPSKARLGMGQYLDNLTTIYAWGDPRIAAFQILLPISYVLMISPVFLFFSRFKRSLITAALALVFCFSFLSIRSGNLNLGIVGIAGLSTGLAVNGRESSFSLRNRWVIFVCLFGCVCLMSYLSRNTLTYSIGIMAVLKLFYDLGNTLDLKSRVNRAIILFGQYSLVSYIMQIVFLQAMVRVLSRQRWGFGIETISIFILTNIFLLVLCGLIKVLRGRYEFTDKTYRFVFS